MVDIAYYCYSRARVYGSWQSGLGQHRHPVVDEVVVFEPLGGGGGCAS